MNEEKLNILGISISTLNHQEVLKKIDGFLASNKSNFLVTANPEIILQALRDEEYFVMLHKANLVIPDGTGLAFAAWALFANIHRFTGADLTEILLAKAEKEGIKVAILLWEKGLTDDQEIVGVLKNKYPQLKLICQAISRNVDKKIEGKIDDFAPQLIFVALGSPWQEKIIFHQLLKKYYLKLAIGVGGTFDFISGKVVRAPKLMRLLGLEWIWRVCSQSKGGRRQRLKRIYNAFFVFVAKYLYWRFVMPFCYRPNVACLLYKKVNENYKILIVKRADIENHWQLPQGGRDGLEIEVAGKKELEEEVNVSSNDLKTVEVFKNLFKYRFDHKDWGKDYMTSTQRHGGYKGQRQSLYIAEFLGQDSNIKINYWDHDDWKWVDAENFLEEVHFIRRAGYKIYFDKFTKIINKQYGKS